MGRANPELDGIVGPRDMCKVQVCSWRQGKEVELTSLERAYDRRSLLASQKDRGLDGCISASIPAAELTSAT
jgi:hypothetical protein